MMMFHKTNLGRFGAGLPADLQGYVPQAGDGPWRFAVDHGGRSTHDADGNLTAYGRRWEEKGFPRWRDRAIVATRRAAAALARWQGRA